MKIHLINLLAIVLLIQSCSKDENRPTSTVIFEVNGTGAVELISHSKDCNPQQLGCYLNSVFENPTLPFQVTVENYYSDLIGMKIYVADESQKDIITELKITIDGESQILREEDFSWWDDSPFGIELEFSVRK